MHRGVLYGVVAFGLAVNLGAFLYALATEGLGTAVMVFAVLVLGLVLYPLKYLGHRPALRGGRRETVGVALLVFALLVAAGGIIVGVVGREPWFEAAAGLLVIAVVVAMAGVLVLRGRRKAPDAMGWHP